ncbi:MAG: hypothetical protein ACTSYX_10610 [Candidatus Thorarchaeota archaeon]
MDGATTDDSPASVFNLAGLPPVDSQGHQGSCVGWATAYYCITHQVARAMNYWNASDPTHQFSLAFTYNQINDGTDSGSYHIDAAALFQEIGCATLTTAPYDQNDCVTWPSPRAYAEAMHYRIDTVVHGDLITDSDLETLKSYLAQRATERPCPS